MTKKVHVCTHCGSPRVFADAWASLNTDEVRTYDNTHCDDCDGECRTKEIEVPDEFDLDIDFDPLTCHENAWVARFDYWLKRLYHIDIDDTGQERADLFRRFGEYAPFVAVDIFGDKYGLIRANK